MLVARPGTKLADVQVVAAHPVAYAQCHLWLDAKLPDHEHLPATSNVTAALQLLAEGSVADAAVAPPGIDDEHPVEVLATKIGDNPNAVTRFVLVSSTRVHPAAHRRRQDERHRRAADRGARARWSRCSSSSRPAA